jgi:sugar lactone lactonase YvrE
MRVTPLLACLLLACDPSVSVDAGTDAPVVPRDAGMPVVEAFADLGVTSEGIALGRTSDGAPVIYVSTQDDRIVRVAPDGVVGDFVSLRGALGIAVRATGELVVCGKQDEAAGGRAGLFEVALDGTITELTTASPGGGPFVLTNFVAIASDGSLVFSDSAGDALYRADADGANVTLITGTITYPNGLGFSPDGDTLYVASWDTTTLYALPFDATTSTYGAPTAAIEDVSNVDGVVPTSSGALVLVTSTSGVYAVDPSAPSAMPDELVPARALALPANGVFGDSAFGVTELYLTSLSRSSLFVAHTDRMAPLAP